MKEIFNTRNRYLQLRKREISRIVYNRTKEFDRCMRKKGKISYREAKLHPQWFIVSDFKKSNK